MPLDINKYMSPHQDKKEELLEKKYTWVDRSVAFSLGVILGASAAIVFFIFNTLIK